MDTRFRYLDISFILGTGHNLAGGVGWWKLWVVTYFLARKKGGS